MCLAVPGRIESIHELHGLRMARMDFGGVRKDVCLAYLPEANIGDYAIVHVGFAIQRVDEQAALETLQTFAELGIDPELEVGTRVEEWTPSHEADAPPTPEPILLEPPSATREDVP